MALTSPFLTLGPVLYHWQPEIWRDFYFRMADEAPVNTVYLGETVCAKRSPFYEPFLDEVAKRLASAGKEVVFSTLSLVMNKYEREEVRTRSGGDDKLVEVNDIAALAHVKGRPHVIGPAINCYNEESMAFFKAMGATRICLPVELPAASIEKLAAAAPRLGLELEVMAYGRMPLAVSARCYHARVHKLSKDSCQFVCNRDPDGLPLTTLEREDFLTVNGIQTLSHGCLNLLADLEHLHAQGVELFRLSPQSGDMVAVAQIFRDVADAKLDAGEATARLRETGFDAPFVNGYLQAKPGAEWHDSTLG